MVPSHSQTLPLWFCLTSWQIVFVKNHISRVLKGYHHAGSTIHHQIVTQVLASLHDLSRIGVETYPYLCKESSPHSTLGREYFSVPGPQLLGSLKQGPFSRNMFSLVGVMTKCCVFLLAPSGLNFLWFHECHSCRITLSPFRDGLWSSPIPQYKTGITQILRASSWVFYLRKGLALKHI